MSGTAQPKVELRAATESDEEWLAHHYALNDFVPSNRRSDYVVIAQRNGERAGAGRLVGQGEALELGGIFVSEEHRGLGLSRLIVGHLVHRGRDETLYCLPFAKLSALYTSFGFEPCELSEAPHAIAEKFLWCQQHYADEVRLLRREADK